jgi:hypothetical protein
LIVITIVLWEFSLTEEKTMYSAITRPSLLKHHLLPSHSLALRVGQLLAGIPPG